MPENTTKVHYVIETINVGGIAGDEIKDGLAGKRSSMFAWLKNSNFISRFDSKHKIYLLQELNSPVDTRLVNQWEKQWGGKMIINSHLDKNRGVGILFHPSLNPIISTEHPPVMPQFGPLAGRVVSVTIKMGGDWISLISIYAPTGDANRARSLFFKKLIEATSHLPNRIYGGDFNYVDNPLLDKSQNKSTYGTLGGDPWKGHVTASGMADPYRIIHPDGRAYSHRSPKLQNRIDRFYIDRSPRGWVAKVAHYHCPHSHDHSLVSMLITTDETVSRGKDRWFFNNSHLMSPSFVVMISGLIKQYEIRNDARKNEIGPAVWLDELLSYLKSAVIEYSKDKKIHTNRSLKALEHTFNALSSARDVMDPPSPLILSQIKEIRLKMEVIHRSQTYGAKVRSRSRFVSSHEQPTSVFYQMAKARRRGSFIQEVRDDSDPSVPISDRHIATDQDGKQQIFKSYYEHLFSNKIISDEDMHTTSALLTPIDSGQASQCEGEMSVSELQMALKTFHNNKSPGPDGFGKEFWKVFWVQLAPHLAQACNHSYLTTSLSPLMSSGYISLLFKKDDKADVKKYRPLTLLPFHYKILTKALTIRLAKVITDLCDSTQTGFIAGRYIMENIRLVLDTIDHCQAESIPAYWVMLDFEKAYDRVSWVYLHACLKAAGLGSEFRRWITTLYPLDPATHPGHYTDLNMDINIALTHHTSIMRQLIMNGHATDPITLHCGVAQGCPLSCLLFVLCVEPLHILIRQSDITGVKIPSPIGLDPMGPLAIQGQCRTDMIAAKVSKIDNVRSIKYTKACIQLARQDYTDSAQSRKERLAALALELRGHTELGKELDAQIEAFISQLDEMNAALASQARHVKSVGYADHTAVLLAE